MKQIYTLAFLMSSSLSLFAAWDGTTTEWTKGEGTQENPYLIESEENFAYLQQTVNAGETYEGKFFILNADLDMSGEIFNPIGFFDDYTLDGEWHEDSMTFLGTFDGNFHTIDNVSIELALPDADDLGGVGLFAIGKTGTVIKNLKLGENFRLDAKGSNSSGALMGYAQGVVIENCSFSGTVIGGSTETGGLIGYASQGSIVNGCINYGTVTGNSFTGGIAGTLENAVMSNCMNVGTVTGNTGCYWVAGIVSWALNSEISSCVSIGKILGEEGSSFLPGISPVCAEIEKSTALNCFYVRDLTGCAPMGNQNGVVSVTESELKSAETLEKLNGEETPGPWVSDEETGPTLAWTLESSIDAGVASLRSSNETLNIKVLNGQLYITAEDATYAVYDLGGKKIASGKVNQEISLRLPTRGVYAVIVRSSEGLTKSMKIEI